MENKGILLVILWTLVMIEGSPHDESTQIAAVEGLITRILPGYSNLFQLNIIPNSEIDYFEVETYESDGNVVVSLSGTDGVTLASALNWYLKNKCNSMVSWEGNNINIPSPAPTVTPKVVQTSPYKWRYFLNTCTFGYSTVWWNFTQWESLIDWMALNGINMPLSFVGQEYIWQIVYQQLGLSLEELSPFFSGPAYLPWNRMGNLDGWQGVLPQSWIEDQFELQLQILQRLRSFGMKAVLPGFAGHVPAALTRMYPSAAITVLDKWNNFTGTYYLSPVDPLFSAIGELFIKTQNQLLGTDHLYNADPFNEETPPSNETAFLTSVSSTIYQAMAAADPDAIWVVQGWFLVDQSDFWGPNETKAFFDGVESNQMIVLDLWSEESPMWNETHNFYGKPYIWNMLAYFGGKNTLYGMVEALNNGPIEALHSNGTTISGLGLTPEGILQNPFMYELWSDLVWSTESLDLDSWASNYSLRRYGQEFQAAEEAWDLLMWSVFNSVEDQFGPTGSVVVSTPQLFLTFIPCCTPVDPYYNTSDVEEALLLLMSLSEELSSSETFQADLVDVTNVFLGNVALDLSHQLAEAFNNSDAQAFADLSVQFLELMDDEDVLLSSNEYFLLGRWIADARSCGSTEDEKDLYEINARAQLTLWGPFGEANQISDYAWKYWSGLVSGYYKPRWNLFFSTVQTLLDANTSDTFNQSAFDLEMLEADEFWIYEDQSYIIEPIGNTIDIVRNILEKWS